MKEKWIEIPGFPNYEISSKGKVKNIMTGNILTPVKNGTGYEQVIIRNYLDVPKHKLIRRLVAESFVLNPDPETFKLVKSYTNNKTEYDAENLYWSDRRH